MHIEISISLNQVHPQDRERVSVALDILSSVRYINSRKVEETDAANPVAAVKLSPPAPVAVADPVVTTADTPAAVVGADPPPEKKRRKRRTKAEIEAEKLAKEAEAAAPAPAAAPVAQDDFLATPAPHTAEVTVPPKPAAAPPAGAPSEDDMRGLVVDAVNRLKEAGNSNPTLEVVNTLSTVGGAPKVSEIDPAKWGEVAVALQGLGLPI